MGKVSDIENVMRYFSVNQVEKERHYKGAYIQRAKIWKRKILQRKYVQERKRKHK